MTPTLSADVGPDVVCASLSQIVHRFAEASDYPYATLVRPLLQGAAGVRIGDLRAERKVERRDDVLWLDGDYVRRTCDPGDRAFVPDGEERRAACVLYFLHEALHLPQGLGEKVTISRLRATGAESTLMHCDLAADHGAACLGAWAERRWRLSWLKELQGRTLAGFPVGPHHAPGARLRKCRRLAALRLDAGMRALGWASPEDGTGGYCWPEYDSAGGDLLLFHSAPLQRAVCIAGITAAEAKVLDNAADPGCGVSLEDLDQVCARVLARAQRLTGCH